MITTPPSVHRYFKRVRPECSLIFNARPQSRLGTMYVHHWDWAVVGVRAHPSFTLTIQMTVRSQNFSEVPSIGTRRFFTIICSSFNDYYLPYPCRKFLFLLGCWKRARLSPYHATTLISRSLQGRLWKSLSQPCIQTSWGRLLCIVCNTCGAYLPSFLLKFVSLRLTFPFSSLYELAQHD